MSESSSSREDSTPSSEEEVYDEGIRLHTHKGKLEDILERAAKVAPNLSHDQLVHIFKEYFQNESIFFNKLRMMAESAVRDDSGWITQSQTPSKTQTYTKEEEALKAKYQDYNFLDDKELIARVHKRTSNRDYQKPKNDRRDDRREHNQTFKPKNKFVEKREEEISSKVNKSKDEPPRSKYVEKKEDNKEHKDEKKDQKILKDVSKKESLKQSKDSHSSNLESAKDTKQHPKPKVQEPSAQTKHPKPAVQIHPAQAVVTQPQPPKPNVPVSVPPPAHTLTEPQRVQHHPTSTSSIKSGASDSGDLSESVKQAFQKTCKENPYILGFIKPNVKVQRIEYVSTPDGRATEVRVRVLADK